MLFAEIILPLAIPKTLTYGVPGNLQENICEGQRVEVEFGKNKIYAGIVYELHQRKPESYRTKPVRKILDKHPIVSPIQLRFWRWIADYYCCTLGDVMQAALPAHLKLMSDAILVWNEAVLSLPQSLSDEGFLLAEALQLRKKLTVAEARMITDGKNHAHAITELLDEQIAFIEDKLKEKYKPKTEKYVGLNSVYERDETKLEAVFDHLKNAPRQSELLLRFFQLKQSGQEVSVTELLKKTRATSSQLKALTQKGILEIYTKEVSRLVRPEGVKMQQQKPQFQLNNEQKTALLSIKKQWSSKDVVLLQGVTGSGKTMIYIRLIEEQIKKGNQTLFLLPEIALTTHFVQRLYAYFGDQLGVYHSRFSNNERVEIWNKVQDGTYKVVMGARSAIWLPFQNLQMIIVDEEQESSYKQQDPAPRFHARDTAIFLAALFKGKTLLGSATPSLESAYNVQTKKYGYASLKNRYQGQAMPEVQTVHAGNLRPSLSSVLTVPLLEAIQQNFAAGKQVLLFQNKRGYAPFLICSGCGYIPHCRNCDVSLTYHKFDDRLHCHYCGQKSLPMKVCPRCGQTKMVTRSFGTERIEEELKRIFPKRKVARMDTDSVRGKNKLTQLIRDFERGSIDILVGTQMIVKGLDFENVGLVGIVSADSLWSYPDFRVNERAFQLMVQVSGRAGRTLDGKGQVYIQAFNLKHAMLPLVAQHDYRGFYQAEIKVREEFGYSPFSKLVKITLKHQQQQKAYMAANYVSEQLHNIPEMAVQGPSPALVAKVRNQFLFEIRLKLSRNSHQLSKQKIALLQAVQKLQTLRGYSGVSVIVDVDPY